MGFLDFFTSDIAIDLGTANTLIIYRDKIVVDEPSIIALDKQANKVLAIGREAMQMHEKTHEHIKTIRPLKEGVIADFQAAELMIRGLIKMIDTGKRLFPPSYRMVICIPSGITEVEKRAVRDSAEAMLADSSAELVLNAAVVEIRQDGERAVVVTADGAEHLARAVVVTLPLHVLNDVRFEPELSAGNDGSGDVAPDRALRTDEEPGRVEAELHVNVRSQVRGDRSFEPQAVERTDAGWVEPELRRQRFGFRVNAHVEAQANEIRSRSQAASEEVDQPVAVDQGVDGDPERAQQIRTARRVIGGGDARVVDIDPGNGQAEGAREKQRGPARAAAKFQQP